MTSVTIVGTDLPGRSFGTHPNVHVGVQRGQAVEQLTPGSADRAEFTVDIGAARDHDGAPDYRGPHVQGRPGERFIYLSWGTVGTDGAYEMFRRAKLWLSGLPEDVHAALDAGRPVRADLALTDSRGGPLCASVRPPLVTWTVGG